MTETKRRNSTAGISLFNEEPHKQNDTKRRNSTSAIASLSRGELKLSPFLKNALFCKKQKAATTSNRPIMEPRPEKPRSGTKVRFVEQSDGSIQGDASVQSRSTVRLSPEEVKSLWWSKDERRAMKRRAQKIAIRFLSVTAKYHLAVEQMLSKCRNENGSNTRELKDRNYYFAQEEALRLLINHDARGLELAMIASLNLQSCRFYHRCCKGAITSVLNTQAMWKCSALKSSDEQAEMIATQLSKHSEITTRFARVLAEGDARVARGHYNIDIDEASILTPALTEESSLSTFSSDDYDFSDGSLTI
jgi:hypothetical protein